jgi:hypothetical protein
VLVGRVSSFLTSITHCLPTLNTPSFPAHAPLHPCPSPLCAQPVLSLARECDPSGRRTLGVLTKPDQIEEGCHEQWMAVLGGTR